VEKESERSVLNNDEGKSEMLTLDIYIYISMSTIKKTLRRTWTAPRT